MGSNVIVPQPPSPAGGPAPLDPVIAALAPDGVSASMAQLAENGMGSCDDATRPDEEPGR